MDDERGSSVAAVVVHRNQPSRAIAVIDRLVADPAVGTCIVIDNNSSASAIEQLAAGIPEQVSLHETGENLGFGPGANLGVELAFEATSATHVVIAPHDADFSTGAVAGLLAHFDSPQRRGAVSADVGDGMTPTVDPFLGAISVPTTETDGFEETVYPHGTLLMVSRAFVDDVGLFDPRYFAYCEEADLGLRAAAGGWVVGIARDVPVFNPQMASNAAVIDYLQLRNTLLLLRSHFGRRQSGFRIAVALWELAAGVIRPGGRDPFFSARARLLALADHLRGRYGAPPESLWR